MPCHISPILPMGLCNLCSYWLRPPTSSTACRQLATVQWTRRLCVLPWWAKQTTEFMTSQPPGTKRYVPTHNPIHISCLAYIKVFISQSIKQAKLTPHFPSDQTLVIVHRDHPPLAYRMPRLPPVNLIIG